jgi:tight adherence protein C
MIEFELIHWAAFLTVSSLVILAFLLLQRKRSALDSRLDGLSGREAVESNQSTLAQFALSSLPKMGGTLLPRDEDQRTKLQARLIGAGYYQRQALAVFLGVKLLFTIGPALVGLLIGLSGIAALSKSVIFGAIGGVAGMIGPSFWLDMKKRQRQREFRIALPDALDIMVICLEGGVSLPGAIRRLGAELRTAHPTLATEMLIVQREIQLGRTAGEALRKFGDRCDLEEVRSLAGVINQAERFGASLVRALRVHADTMRGKRMQYAEEMAQKAAIKILFPTLLCIFPSIFVVILGPAVLQMLDLFARLKH